MLPQPEKADTATKMRGSPKCTRDSVRERGGGQEGRWLAPPVRTADGILVNEGKSLSSLRSTWDQTSPTKREAAVGPRHGWVWTQTRGVPTARASEAGRAAAELRGKRAPNESTGASHYRERPCHYPWARGTLTNACEVQYSRGHGGVLLGLVVEDQDLWRPPGTLADGPGTGPCPWLWPFAFGLTPQLLSFQ